MRRRERATALGWDIWIIIALTLVRVRMSLRRRGLGKTLAKLTESSVANSKSSDPEHSDGHAITRAVSAVSAFLPGRWRCLEQACALYAVLRRCGLSPTLRIGVSPFGFRAHAWVELNGLSLEENTDFLRTLRTFPLPTDERFSNRSQA
jgi:hypothetical protein